MTTPLIAELGRGLLAAIHTLSLNNLVALATAQEPHTQNQAHAGDMVSIRRKNPRRIRPTEVAAVHLSQASWHIWDALMPTMMSFVRLRTCIFVGDALVSDDFRALSAYAGPGSPRTIYIDKGGSSEKRSILPSMVSSCCTQHKHRSWRVLLRWNGKQVYLRSLPSREEATRMYRRALCVIGKLTSEVKLTVDERTELSGLSWQSFISTVSDSYVIFLIVAESMRLQKQGHAKLKVTVVPDRKDSSLHSATDELAISSKGDEGRQCGTGGTHDEGRVPDQSRPHHISTRTQASPQDLHIKQQRARKRAQNVQVRRDVSKLQGVSEKYGKWQASIKVGSKKVHLGTAATSLDAAKLYDRAAFVLQRMTNFSLSDADKEELSQRTWESHLASLHVVNLGKGDRGESTLAS
eukprot:SM000098S25156  [mRNA]  locus=s98:443722:447093:- [translate_table: standard]